MLLSPRSLLKAEPAILKRPLPQLATRLSRRSSAKADHSSVTPQQRIGGSQAGTAALAIEIREW
ncbi:MAG: hypothetical protein JHC52_11885 [Chthoniobacterales bacterium]|jgi:hypothetical protein|nr:hypothetical protein [Chthoniobacterales bacterium]